MKETRTRPVGVTLAGLLHIVVGSLVLLGLVAKLAMGIANGIPLFSLAWIAVAAFLGPGLGNALWKGRPWSWFAASFAYVGAAIVGWTAMPRLLEMLPIDLPYGLVRGLTVGEIVVATLLALVTFTGPVAGWFGIRRRILWAPLLAEIALAVGLLFGVLALVRPQAPPREDIAERLQRMGEARMNSPEEIALMLDRLENGSVEERISAAWALGRAGRGDVVPRLLQAARGDSDVNVRMNAIEAVATLGGAEVESDLVGFLGDDEKEVRITALRGLANERFAGAVDDVGRVLVEDAELRAAAADALGSMGSTDAVPYLLQVASDPDQDVRGRVAFALGKLQDARAVETLIAMLGDPAWAVRANAAQALGMIGERSARGALEKLRQDPSEQVQAAAETALGKLP